MTEESTPDPVRVALATLLREDAVLKTLATGVHFQLAPQDPSAPVPFIVFENPAGTESWCFEGEPMEEGEILVKGVGVVKDAEAIDRRCRQLLNEEKLLIDGYEVLFLRSSSFVNYDEVVDGERFQHTGHNYKLTVEKKE